MKQLLASCAIAFSTYSRIPMPQVEWNKKNMRFTLFFFPLVGAAVGAAFWGADALCRLLDLGAVFTAVLMNNQIMRYGGPQALAVYGVIAAVSPLFQAVFGGVGQAVQPLASANCGAGRWDRVRAFWRLGLGTSLALGAAFTCLGELFPRAVTRLFISAAPRRWPWPRGCSGPTSCCSPPWG